MIRQLPLLPTILVVAAACVMVALGIWQIGRAEEKAAMLARFETSIGNTKEAAFPSEGSGEDVWFRRSSVVCKNVVSLETVAGTGAEGQKGWTRRAVCKGASRDASLIVDLGFSPALQEPDWKGGMATGVIAPGPRLVADPPLAGLEPLAKPDPNDLPNNHIAYAGQWFFFALTALVIYWFAVRSRLIRKR